MFNRGNVTHGLAAGLLTGLLVVSPVCLVRGGALDLSFAWQEAAFYLIAIFANASEAALGFRLYVEHKTKRQRTFMALLVSVCVFLYVACSALCQKLGWASLGPAWKTAGFGLFALGALVRLWAISMPECSRGSLVPSWLEYRAQDKGPYHYLRYPDLTGIILMQTGLPLIFNTWLPLFALPGLFVVLNWQIRSQEAMLVNELGEDYVNYTMRTWRLIPRIF